VSGEIARALGLPVPDLHGPGCGSRAHRAGP
jgi:hypothetical protein